MARPRLSPHGRTLVKRIRAEMKQAGVRLRIHKSAVIRADGDECGGYFDADNRVVAVASVESEVRFLIVLTHEFIHFCQWRDYLLGRRTRLARAWKNSLAADGLGSKGLSPAERYEAYRALLELERQACVGGIRLIEQGQFGTALEREMLTKAEALYLYCHRLMFEKRRWFRSGSSNLTKWLEDPQIWMATPSRLRGVDFNRIPRTLRKLLLRLF